ncbi:mismatch-specific DNA-glycosylase [Arthrobacter cupressi]|uniref:G/U mismatch-specific uracil-DNA glycosylase n=1 Tax=Arthrobacter cupressi TaxID=1045773 RepID=A0A1G8IEC3_9MICC|nr:mismatch-specific DNA-glycosylase [Arthrobacter cupressi]NYD78988.1 TDG/mug DNA glycosylase family protein [Arthrobacter cupressi]SDI17157.1 G/U mismatch-specific uracil-DNA glycosylase [Arthrobacter cupressi]
MLPDLIVPNLRVVFVGTAVGNRSAIRHHYYSGVGNEFWLLLFNAGFTPILLAAEQDGLLTDYGIGMTDLNKDVVQSNDLNLDLNKGISEFEAKISEFSPNYVAFNGKTAGAAYAKGQGFSKPMLGLQTWKVATSKVFILPSSSGANRRSSYEGRDTRLAWWAELGDLVQG